MDLFIGQHVVWLQISIVLLLGFLTLKHKLPYLFEELFKKVYPIKFLVGIIATCLLLIGFVVSFHSQVFTSHDIYNTSISESGSKKNAYEWLNLSHVYRFPIEQFSPESSIIQINQFDFESVKKEKSYNYLFVVDKTGSTREDKTTQKITKSIRENIISALGNDLNKSRDKISRLTDLSDLLLIYSIYNQYKHLQNYNSSGKIKVGVYWGDDNQKIIYLNNYDQFTLNSIDNLIDSYIDSINAGKIYSNTDYEALIHDISSSGCNDGSIKSDTTLNFIVTLVGDLYHEKEISLNAVNNSISELGSLKNKNIEQICLFRVPINPTNISNGQNINEAEAIATKVNSFFRDRFKKYLLYNEIKLASVTSHSFIKEYINSQILPPNKTLGEESEVSMYYPFISSTGAINSSANIKFKNKDKLLRDSIYISLKSNDEFENSGEIIVNNNQIIKLNETKKIGLTENSEINISFSGNKLSDKYYLDIYFHNANKRIISQIIFREKLTHTSALCLIFLYTLLYSSVTLLLLILGISIYIKSPNRFYQFLGTFLCIIPLLILIFSYSPNILILVLTYKSEYWYKLFIASTFPLVYIALLFTFNRKRINMLIAQFDDPFSSSD